MTAGSGVLLLATWMRWWPLSLTEALGFATGGTCVWLCVREHLWNWPLGLANNILFFALFWHARLYADMASSGSWATPSTCRSTSRATST